jgi:hypothetical protein
MHTDFVLDALELATLKWVHWFGLEVSEAKRLRELDSHCRMPVESLAIGFAFTTPSALTRHWV